MPVNRYTSKWNGSRVDWEHRVIAGRVIGRQLPSKAVIHHIDGNGRNNNHQNLVICEDKAYHALLHRRIRIQAAGGNPNTDVWCSTCKRPRPMTWFTRRLTGADAGRFVSHCRDCNRAKARARALVKRIA